VKTEPSIRKTESKLKRQFLQLIKSHTQN